MQTEDNVDPYSQNNYYSGGKNGNMYGWENKPGSVQVMYNDVARRIDHWNGKDVFPASLSRGQEYTYDETVPVGSPQRQKIEDTTVAALLIDRSTGEIVTAAKCRVGEKSSTGDIMAYTSSVRALPGAISVEGDFTTAENLSSRRFESCYPQPGRSCRTARRHLYRERVRVRPRIHY